MSFAKKVLLVLITPLFTLLLFTTALDFGILRTAGHPANVKKIIADSGIYQNVVPAALDQAKKASGGGGEVSLTDPAVKDAATKTFTPQFIRSSTENVIDSVYRWLDGKTAFPDFRIDLSQQKVTFADAIAQAAQTRAAGLPTCTVLPVSSSFDVFNATCLPAGITAAQAGSQARASLLSGQGFLDEPVIDAASVKGSNSSQSVFTDQLKSLPKQYQNAKKTPLVLAVMAILVGAAIVLLSSSWQRGLRRVGVGLLVTGAFMVVFAWALNYGVNQKALPKLKFDNAVMQSDVRSLVSDLTKAVDNNYWLFGGLYIILGAGAIGVPMLMAKRSSSPKPAGLDTTENKSPLSPENVQGSATVKKTTKKQIKIQ